MIDLINQHLEQAIAPLHDGKVKEAMLYSLLAPGKRLRPTLFLKVLQANGVNYRQYVDVACAVEMVHTYSLIHDDLPAMDNDDLRRGQKTCHKQFDEATAILAGDALLTLAFSTIAHASVLTDHQKVQLTTILADASGQDGMIYGQQQDLYFEDHQANAEELKDIHLHKTGKLIQAPLMMGACICDEEHLETYALLGEKIGIAFQIQDDLLDVLGDEEKLGKKVGSDEENHKSTYVTLYGIDKCKEMTEDYFRQAFEQVYGLRVNHGILLEQIEKLIKREN